MAPRASFYVVVPLLSVVATLLAVELGLALLRPTPYSMEQNMYFEPDPHTGYRLKPSSEGTFQNGITAVANRHGHRDDPVGIEKPPGVFRILVLGDSFSVGASVEQDEAWPQVLERLLDAPAFRARLPAPPRRFEVVNASVGGWQAYQYAEYYEHYGRDFAPDLVLVGFFVGNDTYDEAEELALLDTAVLGRRVTRRAAQNPWIAPKVWLYERSHLARRLWARSAPARDFRREHCRDFTRFHQKQQRERALNQRRRSPQLERAVTQHSVEQILRIQRAADEVPVLVVLIPDENQINPALLRIVFGADLKARYDLDMPQSMLVDVLARKGIEAIDLLPAFRSDPRCLYMNDTHWTPQGHALAAARIRDALAARPLWKTRSTASSGD